MSGPVRKIMGLETTDERNRKMNSLEKLSYEYKIARRLADEVEEAQLDLEQSPEWLEDIAVEIRHVIVDLRCKIVEMEDGRNH